MIQQISLFPDLFSTSYEDLQGGGQLFSPWNISLSLVKKRENQRGLSKQHFIKYKSNTLHKYIEPVPRNQLKEEPANSQTLI